MAGVRPAARMLSAGRRILASPFLPLGLLALVVVLGIAQRRVGFHILITGLLDEPAHLSTAALVLLALLGWPRLLRNPTFSVTALLCSMAIDIDHVPLYAGVPGIDVGGRPFSHSLATVALALLVWLICGRSPIALGVAVGVLLHFVRDIATGTGLALLWPFSTTTVLLPYDLYIGVLAAMALLAAGRAVLISRQASAD